MTKNKTMTADQAKAICLQFAVDHKLIFEEAGEIGFGRKCVGFISKYGSFVAYNPTLSPDHIATAYIGDRYDEPGGINAYYKGDYIAVLVDDSTGWDQALVDLAIWVEDLRSKNARVVDFLTMATGLQAALSGITASAVLVEGQEIKQEVAA